MQTVTCASCDAVFPASTIRLPNTARCPRCDEPLNGPRRPKFSFVATKLQPFEFLHPAYCTSCGCILASSERAAGVSTICRYPMCHHKRAVAAAMDLQQKKLTEHAEQQARDIDRVEEKLQELNHDPAQYDIAILPAVTSQIEKQDKRRKNALADKLSEIAAEMRLGTTSESTTSHSVHEPPTDSTLIARACATCRGYCCQNGGDKAYLTQQTLARVQAAEPDLSLEELIRRYLDYVPEESHPNSCIYHAAKGCTLPTEMRSDTCNDFYCSGVRSLSSIIGSENANPLVASALKGERVVRLAVINRGEMKYLMGSE